MNKTIYLILILVITLFAKGEWSESVLVAAPETGVSVRNCQIAVDHNGILHVVFTENFSSEYANLKYSQSTDGGKTWSPQVNLTPDNTTERVYDPRIVIDSENNVHIIFYYIDAGNPIYYLNNIGGSWSDPEYLGIGLTSVPLFEIDQDDRLYIAFFSGDVATGNSYYVYKDKTGNWTTPNTIPGIDGDGRLYDIHSYNTNLYAVGRDYIPTKSESFARLYKYEKATESWTDAIDISNGSPNSQGRSLYATNNDTIHVVVFNGATLDENSIEYIKGGLDLISWTPPDTIGYNRPLDKQIFVDREDTPHIFETSSTYYDLLGTSNFNNEGWNTEIIVSDTTSYYDNLHVAFCDESEACIVYYYNVTKSIYFQSKIVTNIENPEGMGVINEYKIEKIYPNPFNNETTIIFNIKEQSDVILNLYNANGQLIKKIVDKQFAKGKHQYRFRPDSFTSGIYYCKMMVNGILMDTESVSFIK